MASYVQLHGKHWGPSNEKGEDGKPLRKMFKKGDIVELSPHQYEAFKDKFKPMSVVKAEAEVAIAQADAIAKLEREKAAASASKDGNVGTPTPPILTPGSPQPSAPTGNPAPVSSAVSAPAGSASSSPAPGSK